jgi:ParB-like chromosome segregation protein Spo0J
MSHYSVKAAFEKQVVLLPLDIIAPQKEVTQGHRSGEFYKQLTASLKHVGVIEPLVVYPRGPGDYLLLDGHVRLEILKSIGVKEVKCLLATDDEAYTYNRHVNHIPAVAQHFMLLEALKNGLTEERIAAALDEGDCLGLGFADRLGGGAAPFCLVKHFVAEFMDQSRKGFGL